MNTDFTNHVLATSADYPLLGAARLVPQTRLLISGGDVWRLIEEAFQAGVVHHAATTNKLRQMAELDAERLREEGPHGLKPQFDQIFGPRQNSRRDAG